MDDLEEIIHPTLVDLEEIIHPRLQGYGERSFSPSPHGALAPRTK